MQQTRQQLENKQNKQYFDKIKKEKREDEEHRRRIKEQIARDRAEQMAARQAAKQQRKSANSSPEPSTTSVKRARYCDMCMCYDGENKTINIFLIQRGTAAAAASTTIAVSAFVN